ncbi:PEP-CTERM sorting domain-containing protein [Moritella sp. 36]|uniref:PEP-CTERM sorting domain-containing protein n=1 Tax=Moritella sp. 36 TaxID=2746233 RepID=UPI001BAC9C04|nr:PEP-CTERM sorting domain-containing protein [Moritella sp. 36]QUM90671.1 PEP-CTERM sorting domain-containing protein [Moritella sp. 36]
MKLIQKLILTFSLILSANQVSATTISATLNSWENGWNEGVLYSVNGGVGAGFSSAGLFNFTNNTTQSDFLAFCLEITEPINFGDTADFSIHPATDPEPFGTGPEVAEYIGRLYTNKYASVSDAATAAAFQIALWEIVHEDYNTNGFDLGAGDFILFQLGGGGAILAQDYLDSLNTWTNDVIVDVYHNDGVQDLLQVYPEPPPINVSEPAGLTLFGFGLLGLTLMLRRKATYKSND